jgi:cell wall-associated NlpC family hydrolase
MDVRRLASLVPLTAVLLVAGLPAAASGANTGGAAFGASAGGAAPVAGGATPATPASPAVPATPATPTTPATPAAPSPPSAPATPAAPTALATLAPDGTAVAPAGAPAAVVTAIAAANRIATTPYRYGGGHGSFDDTAYDCSGSVSYALHGAGLVASPMASTGFMTWGRSGPGQWMTIYANKEHMFVVIAGLRFDTSGQKGTATNTRWQPMDRSTKGFVVRHPDGL